MADESTAATTGAAVTTSKPQWTIQDHETALAHLEALQDQLTALRTTIPSIIRPLTRSNSTKTQAFNGLKKAAVSAVGDVSAFRTQWEGEATQDILTRAKESVAKDGDLSAGRDVPVYGWTNVEKLQQDGAVKGEEVSEVDVKREGVKEEGIGS